MSQLGVALAGHGVGTRDDHVREHRCYSILTIGETGEVSRGSEMFRRYEGSSWKWDPIDGPADGAERLATVLLGAGGSTRLRGCSTGCSALTPLQILATRGPRR